MKYKRILLKLSGEALMGNDTYGIDSKVLSFFVDEMISASELGVEIGLVIGGGNIFRGVKGASDGFDRIDGDYIGMLATVMNSVALKSEIEKKDKKAIILSGIAIDSICTKMHFKTARHFLESGYIVIIASGTGNPFFTTDSAAALRALEINADVLIKGTKVDGVYDSDPLKNHNAKKYDTITYEQAYKEKLQIMDLTAFTLCQENNMPIIVFNMNKPGNLKKIVQGEKIGTLIKNL